MNGHKIAFDLDGTIADISPDYFRTLQTTNKIEAYYEKLKLKYHPDRFMRSNDEGYIITNRSADFRQVTTEWLHKHNIDLVLYIIGRGNTDHQDWSMENKIQSIINKADKINELEIEVFFEDVPFYVDMLRRMCHNTKVIQVS